MHQDEIYTKLMYQDEVSSKLAHQSEVSTKLVQFIKMNFPLSHALKYHLYHLKLVWYHIVWYHIVWYHTVWYTVWYHTVWPEGEVYTKLVHQCEVSVKTTSFDLKKKKMHCLVQEEHAVDDFRFCLFGYSVVSSLSYGMITPLSYSVISSLSWS